MQRTFQEDNEVKKILLFTLVALLATFFIDRVYSERNQAQLQQTVINEIKKQIKVKKKLPSLILMNYVILDGTKYMFSDRKRLAVR